VTVSLHSRGHLLMDSSTRYRQPEVWIPWHDIYRLPATNSGRKLDGMSPDIHVQPSTI
jgi:hypothetical protein